MKNESTTPMTIENALLNEVKRHSRKDAIFSRKLMEKVMAGLTEDERRVICLRFGIKPNC